LVIVDFAPHQHEMLREEHAHRRLGFADDEVGGWLAAAGLVAAPPTHLPGDPLTVALWPAVRGVTPQPIRPTQALFGELQP
jgi:ArsR family transcriptional regulator